MTQKTIDHVNQHRRAGGEQEFPPMPDLFAAGWRSGYHDGGDHDCRMFEPTAERAWMDHCMRLRIVKNRKTP